MRGLDEPHRGGDGLGDALGGQGHRRGDVPRRVSVRDGVPARELLDESSQYSSSWTQTGAASNLGRFNLTVTRPTRGLHRASTDWPRLVCLQTPRRSPLTPTARSPTAAACRRCTPKSGAGRGPPGPHVLGCSRGAPPPRPALPGHRPESSRRGLSRRSGQVRDGVRRLQGVQLQRAGTNRPTKGLS